MKTPIQYHSDYRKEYLKHDPFSPTDFFHFAEKYAEYYHKEMSKKPKGKTLQERFEDFQAKLNYYVAEYGHDMVVEFVSYWTEHNEGGKKMRFEMAKNQPFNIKRRLGTFKKNWERYNNASKYQNNSKQNSFELLRKEMGI